MSIAISPSRPWPFLAAGLAHWRPVLLATALAAGLAMRLLYGHANPLWFDETFTGVIAGQATVPDLIHWLRHELSGPLFYAPLWAWARLAGIGDAALRAPSLVCTLAAPLFVLVRGHRDPLMRLSWAVLLLLWLPAAPLASDARPYALLMLLATVQIATLCALLRTPTRRAALRWTLATTAIGLTHYPALIPGVAQGLLLLAVHRRAALRLWPAAAPFLLLAAWMAVHLPFALAVAAKGAADCPDFGWSEITRLPTLIAGGDGLALLLAIAVAMDLIGRREAPAVRPRLQAEGLASVGGVAGFGLMIAIAWLQPGFAPRYFIAAVPALLFAASWWLAGALRRGAPAGAAFVVIALFASVGVAATSWRDPGLDQRHAFELERPSAWLLERPVDRVLFMWTDSSAELAPPWFDRNLAEVGGFFFTRAGRRPVVEMVHAPRGVDATAAVVARAGDDPRTAVLWLANVPSADPARRPDALMRRPGWSCRDWGEGLAVAVACRRVTRF